MDSQQLLKSFLESAKALAQRGRALAIDDIDKTREELQDVRQRIELQLPESGPQRDAMLKNLGAGAATGGLLALLIGTKTGRKILSPAIKLGSLAALSAVGYRVYQNWQQQQSGSADFPRRSIDQLSTADGNARAVNITRVMIAAASADGEIDSGERAAIIQQLRTSDLEDRATELLVDEVQKPIDLKTLAATADSTEAAVEMYLAALTVTDPDNKNERAFLNDLATALQLHPQLKADLEREAGLLKG